MDVNRPLRVAVNAVSLPERMAGIGFYTRMLLIRLLELDPRLELTLFTGRGAAEGFRDLGPRLRIRTLPVSSTAAKILATQLLMPFRLSGFDLVHSVGNVPILLSRSRQVVTVHDLCQRIFPERFGAVKRLYLNAGQSWAERSDAEIITVSRRTREDLLQYHPGYRGRISVVHSASKFPIDKEAGARRDFLFVGTLEPGKNLPLAIEALALLKREHGLEKKLKVIGAKGWKQSRLHGLLAKSGVASQVEFLGYVGDEDLRLHYQRAECLVFPSIYEGFGLPILEAQSQGCPVIAADNSSLREVGGEGCFYFPTRDAQALAELLLRSQRAPAEFAAMRESGFANCAGFDWSRAAAETLAVYRLRASR
jgi:glycosyltransferase involved in cell wall biosynthesis